MILFCNVYNRNYLTQPSNSNEPVIFGTPSQNQRASHKIYIYIMYIYIIYDINKYYNDIYIDTDKLISLEEHTSLAIIRSSNVI